YSSPQSSYRLDGRGELRVPLTWSEGGVTGTKTFVFHRGDYRVQVEYQVHNGGSGPWQARPYAQILRNDPRTKTSMFDVESYAFHGPAIYDGTRYRKLDTTSTQDTHLSLEVRDGWVAALQHHFVSAIVPPRGAPYNFTLGVSGDEYLLSATGPEETLAPGATARFGQVLYTGPKLQRQLEASGRSMAKMKTLQPRIKNLQETYAGDKEKLGRAMMELYQREKINPVAGCLPIIIQIPVFLAFYWVLLESVEMRQAPFAFWIHDLSSRDPWFILPAIMAVAMVLQFQLTPR